MSCPHTNDETNPQSSNFTLTKPHNKALHIHELKKLLAPTGADLLMIVNLLKNTLHDIEKLSKNRDRAETIDDTITVAQSAYFSLEAWLEVCEEALVGLASNHIDSRCPACVAGYTEESKLN